MIVDLILAAIQSILQVMTIVSFGFILTKMGYFTPDNQKWLSKLNMVFFTPCLLFSNIASVMSLETLIAYWPIPVFYLVFTSIFFATVHIICRLINIDKNFRGFVLACVMFMNTNSLPIVVISSLAVSDVGKILYWNADDTKESVTARGISYVLFYAVFGNILRWSYGYSLLQFPNERGEVEINYQSTNTINGDGHHPSISSADSSSTVASSTGDDSRKPIIPVAITPNRFANEHAGLLSSFPTLVSDLDHSDHPTSLKEQIMNILRAIHLKMTPPLYAAMVALSVGLIPPIKNLAFHSFLYPSFTISIQTCGKAAVPLILICLGAQLTNISQSSQDSEWHRKPVWTVVGIRMLLAPLLVIPIVVAFVLYGQQWSQVAGDPVFSVMMIVIGCTPTAINLVQISQVTGAFETEMLHVLFYSYGIVCVPVFTLVIIAALSIIDKLL